MIRWQAVITYRTDAGSVDVTHDIEELEELHHLVERGPHWDTVIRIEVLRVRQVTDVNLTVEEAAKL